MREIVLDTETTGLKPEDGHRIVEIGALEMINHVPTGKVLHLYINPECVIDEEAVAIHGLTNEHLADQPVFADIADAFLDFIGDAKLVIHNARFDMGFINAELARLGRPPLPMERAIDTLDMARRKFPGGQASLDALCRKFGINNSHRALHGAMIDADLLADVYIELIGGKQPGFSLVGAETAPNTAPNTAPSHSDSRTEAAPLPPGGDGTAADNMAAGSIREHRPPRPHAPTEAELAAHKAFIEGLNAPLWAPLWDDSNP